MYALKNLACLKGLSSLKTSILKLPESNTMLAIFLPSKHEKKLVDLKALLGSVDIDLSSFVRINSNFITARGMRLSYSKFMPCNNEKMAVKRTRWAALSVLFVTLPSIYVE